MYLVSSLPEGIHAALRGHVVSGLTSAFSDGMGGLISDTAAPQIGFVIPTQPNATDTNTDVEVNVSVVESNLAELYFNWNGTNYSFYDDELKLMFNFDSVSALGETATKAVDVSGYGNDGTIYGALWNAGGRYGSALSFDGLDDYVSVADDSSLDLSLFSVEFWFRPDEDYDSNSGYASLLYHTNYEVFIDDGRIVFSYLGNNASTTADTWSSGQWYHVLSTFNGHEQKIYVDGILSATNITYFYFYVENSGGDTVASFDNIGNIILTGTCSVGSCTYPADDAFVVQDGSGETVAYVDGAGNLCIEDGDCSGWDVSCSNAGDGSFVVRNELEVVSYINSAGGLCLKGSLTENGSP